MENNKHYIEMAVQPIELMESILTPEEMIGYLKGNMIKYSMRAGHKEGESTEKDVAKFRHYNRFLKSYLETGSTMSYEGMCENDTKHVLREG